VELACGRLSSTPYKIQLKLSQLGYQFSDIASRIRVVEQGPQWVQEHHRDLVSLKVVAQLPRGNEDNIKQLVDLQVPCLGLVVDLANVVHRPLDSPDPPGARVGPVHLFPSVRVRGPPAPLGPEEPLKSGTPQLFGHEGLKRSPGAGTQCRHGLGRYPGLGPDCLLSFCFLHWSRVLRP
jgi:hypothetical protein